MIFWGRLIISVFLFLSVFRLFLASVLDRFLSPWTRLTLISLLAICLAQSLYALFLDSSLLLFLYLLNWLLIHTICIWKFRISASFFAIIDLLHNVIGCDFFFLFVCCFKIVNYSLVASRLYVCCAVFEDSSEDYSFDATEIFLC